MAVSLFLALAVGSRASCAADGVVVPPPGFDQCPGLGQGVEDLVIEQLIGIEPLNDSQYPFSHGLPA